MSSKLINFLLTLIVFELNLFLFSCFLVLWLLGKFENFNFMKLGISKFHFNWKKKTLITKYVLDKFSFV